MNRRSLLQAVCGVALTSAVGPVAAQGLATATADQSWPPAKWPSALADPKLQDRLARTVFTAEEKRNLLRTITDYSAEARAARLPNAGQQGPANRQAAAPAGRRRGFDYLDELYGSHAYDGATSISDRVNRFEDIIAKGNRVWGVFQVVGHHDGMMYGFPGDGKPVVFREMFYRSFNAEGRPLENTGRAEELQIYTGLGGKVAFPQPAQQAAPAVAQAPAPRRAARPPAWGTWPPAKWPSSVKDPKLIGMLTETNWTAEEKRNLQTLLEGLDFRRPDPTTYVPLPMGAVANRRGFDGLDELAGFHGYNAALSVADRENEVEDIIAKDNRVWAVFLGRGHHTGDFYGFKGDNKPLEWREFAYSEFDKDGNRVGGSTRAEELQLYVALGGKVQFPGKDPAPK